MIWSEIKYLFKLSRPRFWLYLAGPVLVGMVYAAGTPGELLTLKNLLLLLYFLIPANIMLYGVNDYFDRDVDEKNPKKDEKEARYDPKTFTDAVVLVSSLAGLGLFLLPEAKLWSAMFLLLSVFYSAPPLRFKIRPFLDSLSNGLYAIPFIIGFTTVSGHLPPIEVIAGGWLWTMAMHTYSAIPDIEPDRKAGIRTTATYLGKTRAFTYCNLIWLASAAAFSLISLPLGALFLIYPVLSVLVYHTEVDVSRAYWYYPYINAVVGMVITLYGLRVLFGV